MLILALLFSAASPHSLFGQVRPVVGLHEHTPRTYALTDATIHLEPGRVIQKG